MEVEPTSFESFAAAKVKLMKYFMTRSYQVNNTYSVENVYNDIMHCFGCETEPNDFLRIHYKVTHMCGDRNCPEHGKEVRLQSRVLRRNMMRCTCEVVY